MHQTKEKNYEVTIEPKRKGGNFWKEIWEYRELLFFLAWRDISVRYKQTVLGVIWFVIKPVVSLVVLTFIFGGLAGFDSGGFPYPIVVFSALIPWNYFSSVLSDTSTSIVGQSSLVTKVYCPRLIIPLSKAIVHLIDTLLTFIILAALMIYYQFVPSWTILALPLFLLLCSAISLGAGSFFTALHVKFRDIGFIVPLIVQFGLYLSPVGFYSSVIPENWRLLYALNPIVCAIDGFRWAILGTPLDLPSFAVSCSMAIALLVFGILYFRRMESNFADII